MPFKDPKKQKRYWKKYGINYRKRHKHYTREWYKLHRDKILARSRRTNISRYGISVEEYERMRAATDVCALCREPFGLAGKLPVLDHDHITGKLRGFIHGSCNRAIGFFGDDSVRCRLAAEYLERHKN